MDNEDAMICSGVKEPGLQDVGLAIVYVDVLFLECISVRNGHEGNILPTIRTHTLTRSPGRGTKNTQA